MADAYGAAGFGGGFGKGLAAVLGQNREAQRRDAALAEERKFREFSTLWPTRWQMAQEANDYAGLEDWLVGYFPDLKKSIKRTGFSFQDLGPLVGQADVAGQPTADPNANLPASAPGGGMDLRAVLPSGGPQDSAPATAPITGADPNAPPLLQATHGAAVMMPGRQTFLGTPMLSSSERAEQATQQDIDKLEKTRIAQMGLARKMLPELQKVDPSITLEDALRYVSKGELVTAASRAAAGGAPYRYGVDREAISKELFNKPYDSLTQQEAAIVLREEKDMRRLEAEASGTGRASAAFNAPMTAAQAQNVPGAQIGTTSAQLAGQQVPTAAQSDRRKSVEETRDALMHIRDTLIPAVLPAADSLEGKAPGASWAVRRRSPKYREQAAALESAVSNIVNVMARSVAEQRGTQTERDALRAEAAIASIHDALLTGDTIESATRRINESLRTLDNILGRIPADVSAKPGEKPAAGGAKPSAAPAAGAPSGPITLDTPVFKGLDGKPTTVRP